MATTTQVECPRCGSPITITSRDVVKGAQISCQCGAVLDTTKASTQLRDTIKDFVRRVNASLKR